MEPSEGKRNGEEREKERVLNGWWPLQKQNHGEVAKEEKRVTYFNPVFNKPQLPRKKQNGPKYVRTKLSQEFCSKRNSTAG